MPSAAHPSHRIMSGDACPLLSGTTSQDVLHTSYIPSSELLATTVLWVLDRLTVPGIQLVAINPVRLKTFQCIFLRSRGMH